MRRDLKMRKGKIAAQAGHACIEASLAALKKENRLKLHSAFMGTYHQRQILCCSHFKIYIGKLAETEQNSAKIGFVVSTKIHKRAVQRNRIKREARDCG